MATSTKATEMVALLAAQMAGATGSKGLVILKILKDGGLGVRGHSNPSWISRESPRLLTVSVKGSVGERVVQLLLRDHYTAQIKAQSVDGKSLIKALAERPVSQKAPLGPLTPFSVTLVKDEDVDASFSFPTTAVEEVIDF